MKAAPFLLVCLIGLFLAPACQRQPGTRVLGETASAPTSEPTTQAALAAPTTATEAPAAVTAPASTPASTAASVPATSTSTAPEEAQQTPGNNLKGGPNDVHDLIIDDSAAVFSQGSTEQVTIDTEPPGVAVPAARAATAPADPPLQAVYTSRVIQTAFPFNELVPSWNITLPEGTGFRAEVRVGRKADDFWTPFYYFGVWGKAAIPEQKVIDDPNGNINVDTFTSTKTFDRIQYRFVLVTAAAGKSPVIRRVGLAYTNTLGDEAFAKANRKPVDPGPPTGWARRLPVPWRSQTVEDAKIRGSICSSTSISMVMQFYGVNVPTAQVAATVFDREYRMYGNWIRNVQGAFQFGITGYLQRFSDYDAVKKYIAEGHPVIASIRVDTPGELRNAPYKTSNGHLIVITGFDAEGNLHINDPAAKTMQAGVVTYFKEDMQKSWLDHGGLGYVLIGKAK